MSRIKVKTLSNITTWSTAFFHQSRYGDHKLVIPFVNLCKPTIASLFINTIHTNNWMQKLFCTITCNRNRAIRNVLCNSKVDIRKKRHVGFFWNCFLSMFFVLVSNIFWKRIYYTDFLPLLGFAIIILLPRCNKIYKV